MSSHMVKKVERFQPYFLENPEDDRLPEAVAGYAAHLQPGFALDMTAEEHEADDSDPHITVRKARYGTSQGITITLHERVEPPGDSPTDGSAIEIATFGLAEGRRASIRYQMHWDKGNRSYLELEVEGPDREAGDIVSAFRKKFAGPDDGDIKRLKKEMEAALKRQEWGTTQDYGQAVLLWRPDDTEALLAIGSSMLISRDIDQAEKLMLRLLALKPDSHQAHLNLGNVWMNRQDYDKAIEHYRQMMELVPNESFGPFILATAHEAKGDTQGAIELYKQAVELKGSRGPTDFPRLAREAIERLSGA